MVPCHDYSMSAFRTTGVYPFNRDAVQVNKSMPQAFYPKALGRETGLAFIPLYSPARSSRSNILSSDATPIPKVPQFTEEHTHFTARFEEGFDISTDERYNHWL